MPIRNGFPFQMGSHSKRSANAKRGQKGSLRTHAHIRFRIQGTKQCSMGHNINACINDAVQRDSFMVHLMPSRRHKTKATLIDRDNSMM
ncbi:hypothetical protein Hdeb2414_s1331g01014101 [Helianthus debilis subsp. tardiflorus]